VYKFDYLLTYFGFICGSQKFNVNTFFLGGGAVTMLWGEGGFTGPIGNSNTVQTQGLIT